MKKYLLSLEVHSVCSLLEPVEVTSIQDLVGSGLAIDLPVLAPVPLKPLCFSTSSPFDKGFDSLFNNFSDGISPFG